jgi:antitoxin (DNA-binding transcriptional repressor) of toxin-antitoxin stability system
MSMPEITQRDLRSRSREIMDAVEHGQSFTVTRDGHQIGELVPIRRRRMFVSRQEFAAMSRNAPEGSLNAFRADQDEAADHEENDPFDR